MAEKKLLLDIITPYKHFYSGEIDMLVVETPTGKMGILYGHIPMIAPVISGPIKIKVDEDEKFASVTNGFVEIDNDNKITLIVDSAEWPEDIDRKRAEEAKARAEERLHMKLSQKEYIESQAALARAIARLKTKGNIRN